MSTSHLNFNHLRSTWLKLETLKCHPMFDIILFDFLVLSFLFYFFRQGDEEIGFSNPVDIDLERGIFTIQRDNVKYIDKCFQ